MLIEIQTLQLQQKIQAQSTGNGTIKLKSPVLDAVFEKDKVSFFGFFDIPLLGADPSAGDANEGNVNITGDKNGLEVKEDSNAEKELSFEVSQIAIGDTVLVFVKGKLEENVIVELNSANN